MKTKIVSTLLNKLRFHSATGLALCAMLCALTAAHAQTTYTFVSLTGTGGSALTGSITVDDANDDGYITSSEISAWSFQSTGLVSFSISSASPGANSQAIGTPGGFSVTPTTLSFNFQSTNANNPFATFAAGADSIQFEETAQGGANPVSWTSGPGHNDAGHYASDVVAAIPEPSTN